MKENYCSEKNGLITGLKEEHKGRSIPYGGLRKGEGSQVEM